MLSSDMTASPKRAPRRRKPAQPRPAQPRSSARGVVLDGFYKDMVWNLRNGVVAITRDGRVAVMNDIAYRVLGMTQRSSDIGKPYTEVLRDVPDVLRIMSGAFEISYLPNRAELRL